MRSQRGITEDLFETYSANSNGFPANCSPPQRSASRNEGGLPEVAEFRIACETRPQIEQRSSWDHPRKQPPLAAVRTALAQSTPNRRTDLAA